jgi:hypothetical protein
MAWEFTLWNHHRKNQFAHTRCRFCTSTWYLIGEKIIAGNIARTNAKISHEPFAISRSAMFNIDSIFHVIVIIYFMHRTN